MMKTITRYVREYRSDAITDPTMVYVNSDDYQRLLHGADDGMRLMVWFNSVSSLVLDYFGEIIDHIEQYDDRTIKLYNNFLGKLFFDDMKDNGYRFFIPNEMRVTLKLYEYKVTGIGVDGVVQFEKAGEVSCV